MPKRPRLRQPLLPHHIPPQLPRRLLRLHRLRQHRLLSLQQTRPHNPRVQQQHHNPLLPQIHRQRLADRVDRCFRGAVCVVASGGVVGDGADAGGDDADFWGRVFRRGGEEDVGQQGLGEEEGPEGVDGEGGGED